MLSLIVAIANNNVIGYNNSLPWPRISQDMKWFRDKTINQVVIMGRKTFESLNSIPLKNRTNIIVTSQAFDGVDTINSQLDIISELKSLETKFTDKEIFIIGGSQLYELTKDIVDRIYLTRIYTDYYGDTYFNIHKQITNMKVTYQDSINEDQKITFTIYEKDTTNG